MAHSSAYNRVAGQSQGKLMYSDQLHERVDDLVQQFLGSALTHEAIGIWPDKRRQCEKFVKQEFKRQYVYGNPLLILAWPIISALISWLVQNTLDDLFGIESGE